MRAIKAGDQIAIDFAGTITEGPTMEENGAMRRLVDRLLALGCPVVIFSARPAKEIEAWLRQHGWPDLPVTNVNYRQAEEGAKRRCETCVMFRAPDGCTLVMIAVRMARRTRSTRSQGCQRC